MPINRSRSSLDHRLLFTPLSRRKKNKNKYNNLFWDPEILFNLSSPHLGFYLIFLASDWLAGVDFSFLPYISDRCLGTGDRDGRIGNELVG